MFIKSTTLAKSLLELIKEKPLQEKKIIENFIGFCREKNLINRLPKIIASLKRISIRQAQEKQLIITTKETINQPIVTEIKSFISADKKTETKIIKNPTIKGGFIAKYNGMIYDGSVKRQLEKLNQDLHI